MKDPVMHEKIAQDGAGGKAVASQRHAAKLAARVLGQPGRSLEPTARSDMEKRLDFDFSRVQVHTGHEAAESARSLGAHAYTVGSHVVFDDGAYAPDRPDGRHLLAHELAHVIQSGLAAASSTSIAEADADRVATQTTATSGPVRPTVGAPRGAVLRQDAGTAVSDVRPPEPAFERHHLLDEQLRPPEPISGLEQPMLEPLHLTVFTDVSDPAVDLAESELLRVLDPFAGTPEMGSIWPFVVDQVQSPKTGHPNKKAPADLYAPDVVEVLGQLKPGKRKGDEDIAVHRKAELLNRVFQKLLTARNKTLGNAGDGGGDLQREWDEQLHEAVKRHIPKELEGYREVRGALLNSFGALAAGSKQAFANINDYYENEIVSADFLGQKLPVHKKMRDALEKTLTLLKNGGHADIAQLVIHVEGLNIRWNTNNPLQLSNHSFGTAIDIDPTHNPNVPRFPVAFVKDVTAAPIPVTPSGSVDWGKLWDRLVFGDRDPALQTMENLLAASSELVRIFRDDDSLANGMLAFAGRSAANTGVKPEDLLAMVRAARSEGGMVRWRYQDPKVKLAKQALEGTAHDALANLLFPPTIGREPPDVFERRRAVVVRLIQMADVYERSFVRDKHGQVKTDKTGQPQRVKADPRAPAGEEALPQLVAHGFASIPIDLISALRAPEGGDLSWLGTNEHGKTGENTRDFMHFELKGRPPLPAARL
jgi:hypothetical protein